jgi:hypothetical protein
LLAVLVTPALASCGSTKIVTKTVPAPTATPPAVPTPASTGTGPSASSFTTMPVYFQGVAGPPMQKPATLELTGDGTLFVMRVQWTAWGGSTATGVGVAEYHGCTPSCAQARLHVALVSVRLSGVRACSGHRFYSSVTLVLRSGQPLDRGFLQRSWSPC